MPIAAYIAIMLSQVNEPIVKLGKREAFAGNRRVKTQGKITWISFSKSTAGMRQPIDFHGNKAPLDDPRFVAGYLIVPSNEATPGSPDLFGMPYWSDRGGTLYVRKSPGICDGKSLHAVPIPYRLSKSAPPRVLSFKHMKPEKEGISEIQETVEVTAPYDPSKLPARYVPVSKKVGPYTVTLKYFDWAEDTIYVKAHIIRGDGTGSTAYLSSDDGNSGFKFGEWIVARGGSLRESGEIKFSGHLQTEKKLKNTFQDHLDFDLAVPLRPLSK